MPCKNPNGTWEYPDLEKVLKAVGLFTLKRYVGVHRATVLFFISNRPIWELCLKVS